MNSYELQPLSIRVPATSANLGPGFDLLGLALTLYTTAEVHFIEPQHYALYDKKGQALPVLEEDNLIRRAYVRILEDRMSEFPGLEVYTRLGVPISRGFGSSAIALVTGVLAACEVLQSRGLNPPGEFEKIQILTELEGHPDNVVPALIGGWVFSHLWQGKINTIKKNLPESLGLVAIIPGQEVSTARSRLKLPSALSKDDVLSNMRGMALWMEYVNTGNPDFLRAAIHCDRMHEPYRIPAIYGFVDLKEKLANECYGMTLSGSGPGILVYYDIDDLSFMPMLEKIVAEVYAEHEISATILPCRPDKEGALCEKISDSSMLTPG